MPSFSFQELVDDLNILLYHACPKDFQGEPVNWGNLKVVELLLVTPIWPELQKPYLSVVIEEAGPSGCDKFKTWLHEYLAMRWPALKKEGLDCFVTTRW
jgi:hypothetical protein